MTDKQLIRMNRDALKDAVEAQAMTDRHTQYEIVVDDALTKAINALTASTHRLEALEAKLAELK